MANRTLFTAMAGIALFWAGPAMGAQGVFRSVAANRPVEVAADEDAPKEDSRLQRASDELQILFEGRIALMFDEVNAAFPMEEKAAGDFRDHTEDAVRAFFGEHKLTYGQADRFRRSPTPIHYETFESFLASEQWMQVFEADLGEEARSLWLERRIYRKQRIQTSLAKVFEAEVTRSFCLQQEEREDLEPITQRAADAQIELGLVGTMSSVIYNGQVPDPMFDRMTGARLKDGLTQPRAELLRLIEIEGRTSYHDYCFEADYLLYDREDSEALRTMLYGCAEALSYRDGGQPKLLSLGFELSGKPNRDNYWEDILRGLLDLDPKRDFDDLPSRTAEEIFDTRTEFFLAVLDERAIFSPELFESLRPLFREYAEEEFKRKSTYRPIKPQIPEVFGVADDGVHGAKGDGDRYLTTKQKAKVTAFRDACSQQQRDVLDV